MVKGSSLSWSREVRQKSITKGDDGINASQSKQDNDKGEGQG